MTQRQAVVIASGRSREGRAAYDAIPSLLRERGVEVMDAYYEPTRKSLAKRVKRVMKRGARLIVICGGDGTLTHAVPLLAHTNCTLGIVPAGTGNSFALGVGIEGSFEAAADAIAHGEETQIDLGTIDGQYFANFLTIGLPSEVAKETPRGLKRAIGAIAYGISGVIPLLIHRPFSAKITWKRHRVDVETHQIIIANGRYYGHQALSKNASLVDGKLTVFVRDAKSKIDLMQTHLALLRGTQERLDGVHLWSTDCEMKIKAKPKVSVAVDGSLLCKTPITVGVAPKALRVLVPSSAAKSA